MLELSSKDFLGRVFQHEISCLQRSESDEPAKEREGDRKRSERWRFVNGSNPGGREITAYTRSQFNYIWCVDHSGRRRIYERLGISDAEVVGPWARSMRSCCVRALPGSMCSVNARCAPLAKSIQ